MPGSSHDGGGSAAEDGHFAGQGGRHAWAHRSSKELHDYLGWEPPLASGPPAASDPAARRAWFDARFDELAGECTPYVTHSTVEHVPNISSPVFCDR